MKRVCIKCGELKEHKARGYCLKCYKDVYNKEYWSYRRHQKIEDRPIKKCIVCGKEFKALVLCDPHQKYCSLKCGRKAVDKRYYKRHPDKIKRKGQNYRKTEIGKLNHRKGEHKRQRELGFFQLFDNPFPKEIPIVWHHITDLITIPFPEKTHLKTNDNIREKHRQKCIPWIEKLYGFNITKLLET